MKKPSSEILSPSLEGEAEQSEAGGEITEH
jgi:hypothetical protein